MTKSLKILLMAALAFGFSSGLKAQEYNHAIGLRVGINSGFEYRYYLDYRHSLKALLSSRNRGVQFHALYEMHQYGPFGIPENFVLFYGFGAHVGYEQWNVVTYAGTQKITGTRGSLLVGVDAVGGMECRFPAVPIALGIELKPYIDLFGKNPIRFQPFDFAFTAKYLF